MRLTLNPNPSPNPSCDDGRAGDDCSDGKLPVPTISSSLQLGLHDSLIAVNEANLLASPTNFDSPLKESASLAEQVATTPHAQLCTIASPCLFSLLPPCTIAPFARFPLFLNFTLRP